MLHLFAPHVVKTNAIALVIYNHRNPGVHSKILAKFQALIQAEILLVGLYHNYLYD
jgi:hypothetical protein